MIACVSPDLIVRSTPRSTSRLSPAASVTPACRLRISRVDMYLSWSGYWSEGDEHVVAIDLDFIGRHGLGGRRPRGLAGAQVEAGPVQPALHRVVVYVALGQRHFRMRADIAQGENLAAGPHHAYRLTAELEAQGALVRQVRQRAGALEGAHASSASIAAVIRSCSSGTSIWPISSPKKPRITSLRASSNGMPRAIR